jgi:uncharacterized protein (DUF2384 family)
MNVEKENLIPFTNLVNECCEVMDHDMVADWISSPNADLNMEVPIDIYREDVGREKVYRLLYFIGTGEADGPLDIDE